MLRKLFNKTLDFEINLIGYKNKGESIVFFLKADNEVVYSGLIDCYEDDSENVALRLLERENITCFDFVCWTHPHDDHTIGLEKILKEYCNEKTSFWLPPFVSKDVEECSSSAKEVYKILFKILESKKRKKMKVREVSDGKTLEKFECFGNVSINPYIFEITSFAPDTSLLGSLKVRERFDGGNIYSVGLVINVGHFYLVLAGDVENRTIKCIPDFNFDIKGKVDYVKIPHHSSPTASCLIDKINSLNVLAPAVATTTVYRINNLPDKHVLEKYVRWGKDIEVYSTGSINSVIEDKKISGVIKTTFDILEKKDIPIETNLYGNAVGIN